MCPQANKQTNKTRKKWFRSDSTKQDEGVKAIVQERGTPDGEQIEAPVHQLDCLIAEAVISFISYGKSTEVKGQS